LPAEVFDRLLPDLKPVTMPLGKVIHDPASVEHVYFHPELYVSMFNMEDGSSAEIAGRR
jgi:hypothetical protein